MTASSTSFDSLPYAIDTDYQENGRRIASSKRRARFSFGFGNAEAIAKKNSLKSGHDCRGQEHQVVIVWSMSSGKQRVLADGIEVYFTRKSKTLESSAACDTLECSWTMKSGHSIRVIGKKCKNKGIRQFDLIIDGLSYWKMPQIFELGSLPQHVNAATTSTHSNTSAPPLRRRTLTPTSSSVSCEPEETSTSQSPSSCEPSPTSATTTYFFDMAGSMSMPKPTSGAQKPSLRRVSSNPFLQDAKDEISVVSALESLVDMNNCGESSTCGNTMSRSTSVSELSVQSNSMQMQMQSQPTLAVYPQNTVVSTVPMTPYQRNYMMKRQANIVTCM